MRSLTLVVLGAGLTLIAASALARPSEEEIARLGGEELTPVGAERAGNAQGTIPDWTGGVTEPPAGWEPGMRRIDLFKDDRILFSIDTDNVDQHADKLSPGQIELIKTYDGYRMDVYPTQRSCAYPESDYEQVKVNARVARVDDECYVQEGLSSPLFPFPANGCEVITNGKLSVFNGLIAYDRMEATLVPTRSGRFVPSRRQQKFFFTNRDPNVESFADLNGIWTKSLSHTVGPPKKAGEMTLVHAQASGHLRAWTYNPGQRRVRRAPNFEYDNPVPGWQNLVTIDQVNGYVGAADRYNWKLVGKQELYVPYNSEKFVDPNLKYEDLVQARYPNRAAMRYELHRVWVVEGTLRERKRHVMPRRVFYIDEDSWLIVVVDAYDRRGSLWRVQESLPQVIYEIPSCVSNGTIYYDLVAGRYVVSPAMNEELEADYLAGHTGRVSDTGFAPDDMRKTGRR
ncbi:MAG: DUF1329 domain-containing protein [Deltaproteobacteria bacterium]|jgi:hypothetical protein|nr:DUF1329 domain-containing protein [Deltaproteobacteria bacterium]MBW2696431.1 DUF1329 domain-containing protein [Deltaproteobacteria bacterium]